MERDVLELLGVEIIFDMEAEVTAEVKLEVVEESTGGVELADWTEEEEALDGVGSLDVRDSEREVDGTGVEDRDESK